MKKVFLITSLVYGSLLFAVEPSVYGAGNIDSTSPYGLTTTEKNVLNNRKRVQQLKNQVTEHQSRISGLTTVVDGLTQDIVELKEQLKESRELARQREDENSKREEDYKKSYALLLEMGKMIDQINSNYVTKESIQDSLSSMEKSLISMQSNLTSMKREFDVAQQTHEQQRSAVQNNTSNNMIIDGREDYNNQTQQMEDSSDTQHYSTNSDNAGSDSSGSYMEGVQLFSHKSYLAASEKFKEAISQNYKVAPSSYYLGEISYFTGDYYAAIAHYKKSASMNNKASYIKTLYLHTALSLSKTGQSEQARGFFKYIYDNYPGTEAAEIAQNNL